jgi:hypothetical protein
MRNWSMLDLNCSFIKTFPPSDLFPLLGHGLSGLMTMSIEVYISPALKGSRKSNAAAHKFQSRSLASVTHSYNIWQMSSGKIGGVFGLRSPNSLCLLSITKLWKMSLYFLEPFALDPWPPVQNQNSATVLWGESIVYLNLPFYCIISL